MTNTILNRRGVPAGLFVSDPRTAEALAAKLAENGIDVVQQTHGAFVWANIIQNTNFAQLKTVVIELPASGDLIEAVKALAKHLDAGTSLILLGRESSVVFYHQLKRQHPKKSLTALKLRLNRSRNRKRLLAAA